MTTPTQLPQLPPGALRDSQFREVHKASHPVAKRWLLQLPGYAAGRAALAAAAAYKPEQAELPPDPVEAMTGRILAALEAGEQIPARLADEVPDVDAAARHQAAAAQAVVAARQILAQRLDQLVASNLGDLHAALTEGLADVVDRARRITAKGPRPEDAEEAIAQGRVEDYTEGQILERRYAELRALQASLVQDVHLNGASGGLAFTWYLANPDEVLDRPLDTNDPGSREGWAATVNPWPDSWIAGDAVWWFSAHENAEPWAPTPQQHAQALRDFQLAQRERRSVVAGAGR